MKGTISHSTREAQDEREVLSYWFPLGIDDAETHLFFTMPLGHAEGPDHPGRLDLAVGRAEEQLRLTPAHLEPIHEHSLGQATAHRDVMARFGRHPHRNVVLGRASTPEESEYLSDEVPVHTRRPRDEHGRR